MDILFLIDIILNFMTAYETPEGYLEPRFTKIAWNYMKFWFLIDLFAVIPIQFFDPSFYTKSAQAAPPVFVSSQDIYNLVTHNQTNFTNYAALIAEEQGKKRPSYNQLMRITRLTRLYRLLRIMRIFKIFKIFRFSHSLQRFLDRIKLNAAASRMIMILMLGFLTVHLGNL